MSPAFTPATAAELCALGFLVGVFGTLVGAGGGFILTPILLLVYPHSSPALLTAISLVAVFFNAGSGTIAYARQRRIDYRSGMIFAVSTLPGSVLGVIVAGKVSRPGFDVVMGVVLIAVAIWLRRGLTEPGDGETSRGQARVITERAPRRFPSASSSALSSGRTSRSG